MAVNSLGGGARGQLLLQVPRGLEVPLERGADLLHERLQLGVLNRREERGVDGVDHLLVIADFFGRIGLSNAAPDLPFSSCMAFT